MKGFLSILRISLELTNTFKRSKNPIRTLQVAGKENGITAFQMELKVKTNQINRTQFLQEMLCFLCIGKTGFNKEQLRIELNEFGKMKISGERLIQGNNWFRFSHEFTVPAYCNLSKISSVEFKDGIVSLIIPKMPAPKGVQDQRPQIKESMLDQKGGHPIDIQDQSMLKCGPCIPIDREDQPMLKTGYAIDRQNQPVPFKECCEYSEGSFPTGLNWIRGLDVNMVVTTMVGLALGIYAVYYVKWQ